MTNRRKWWWLRIVEFCNLSIHPSFERVSAGVQKFWTKNNVPISLIVSFFRVWFFCSASGLPVVIFLMPKMPILVYFGGPMNDRYWYMYVCYGHF
jgi:hypothetical protein